MNLDFDIEAVKTTEFGVGLDDGTGQTFVFVPVDEDVQKVLREMVQSTWDAMQRDEDGPAEYQPSEKHSSTEYLYLPAGDELAAGIRELHDAANLDINGSIFDEPTALFCYFARLTDKKKRRLTALRRATQFKGVLKKRLIRIVSDSLKLIEDRVFKLDSDFDFLIDSENVHILRPAGFEFAGKLQQAILDAVSENAQAIQKDLKFVDMSGVEKYASTRPRAARYLASIRAQGEVNKIDRTLLHKLCKQTGVGVNDETGKVRVDPGHEMGFLEVLDRRRYEVSLVKESPEKYRAASRRKING